VIELLQFVAPAPILRMIFGATGEIGLAVARHWGLLIFLVGALLIYAAFHPWVRGPAMVVAVIEKAVLGPRYIRHILAHASCRSGDRCR